jgi:agmatinase
MCLVLSILLTSISLPFSSCREIIFPPISAIHSPQQYLSPFKDDPAALLEGADFHGLSTFANLPYVKCMSPDEEVEKYDIAILGAPFDTVRFSLYILLWGSACVLCGLILEVEVGQQGW